MDRKKACLLTLLIILGVSAVIVLLVFSNERLNYQYNTFNRTFSNGHVQPAYTINVQSDSYYIAGTNGSTMYFAHSKAPNHLLKINLQSKDTTYIYLKLAGTEQLNYKAIQISVNYPHFFLMDGAARFIYRGSVYDGIAYRFLDDSTFFSQAISISDGSFAMVSMKGYKNVLVKKNIDSSRTDFFPDHLKQQVDGIFCTAGKLCYDPDSKKLIYLYTFRNQFIYMDSNLNILYHGKTIDPIDTAQIKVAKVDSDHAFKLASPPLIVNKGLCMAKGRLYIHSNILAGNDDKKLFETSSTIDVYDLSDASYTYSFHLPKYKRKGIRDFRIIDNVLIALQDDLIVIYHRG